MQSSLVAFQDLTKVPEEIPWWEPCCFGNCPIIGSHLKYFKIASNWGKLSQTYNGGGQECIKFGPQEDVANMAMQKFVVALYLAPYFQQSANSKLPAEI